MSDITFREFMNVSKQQLVKAAAKPPVLRQKHQLTKYINFTLNDGSVINLRPKHSILTCWTYHGTKSELSSFIVIVEDNKLIECINNIDKSKAPSWLKKHTSSFPSIFDENLIKSAVEEL
jgi:hypothetical protein